MPLVPDADAEPELGIGQPGLLLHAEVDSRVRSAQTSIEQASGRGNRLGPRRLGGVALRAYRVRVDGDMHAIVRGSLVLDLIALLGRCRAPSVADLVQ